MKVKSVERFLFDNTFIPSSKKWFSRSYAADWIFVAFLLILLFLLNRFLPTRHRFLPPKDPMYSYPLEPDIIPAWSLYLISILFPCSIFLIMQLFFRSAHDFHHACLGLFATMAITMVGMVLIKHSVGRYRPDYWAILKTDHFEANLSFPSGHASISFAGMVFLSLYLNGKAHVYGESGSALFKSVFVNLPIVLSSVIAISRSVDYHHDFVDTMAGALLGSGVAASVYFLYYPSLFAPNSHVPKSKTVSYSPVEEEEEEGLV